VSELKIILQGDRLEMQAFLDAVGHFASILTGVDKTASGGPRTLRWRLRTLRYQSPAVIGAVAEPIRTDAPDLSRLVGRAVVTGVRSLAERERRPRPQYFSDDTLEAAKALAELAGKHGVESVSIVEENESPTVSPVLITMQVAASVEDLIGIKSEGLGAVEGKLEVVSSRNGLHCNVYDRVTGIAVKCTFSDDLKRKVLDAFEQWVIAHGTVKRDASGKPRQLVLRDLEPIPSAADLPQSILGLDSNYTEGMSPEEWIRKRWE
jgi:hypothetical protein